MKIPTEPISSSGNPILSMARSSSIKSKLQTPHASHKMLTKPTLKNCVGLVILLLFSSLWAIFILGKNTLKVDQTDWLWGDLALINLAWKIYLSDPAASWLMSNRMSYPLEMNFSLFDPMPILLLTLGRLSNLLPDGQYIGAYFALCVALQGLFGYLIIGEIAKSKEPSTHFNEVTKVIGGCFFILTPYTYWRFQGHTALSSQWLLVMSIWISLRTRNSNTDHWILANCATLFIISGFNPYLTFMAGLSTGILIITGFGSNSIGLRILKLAALGITSITGFYIFGFLGAASIDGGGYGAYSMNILGPLDSNGLALLLPIDVFDATQAQTFEGFNYLGMGVLLMIPITATLFARKSLNNPSITLQIRPILIVIAISYLLALSTTLTLSGFKLQLPTPDFVEIILSRLRASGRLFWIGSFWLIVIGIFGTISKLNPRQAVTLLLTLLLIQLIDVAPIARKIHNSISKFKHLEISEQDSKLIPNNIKNVMVFPPWQCAHGGSPGGPRNYEIFGYLVARIQANTNNFYAARTLAEQTKYHCNFSEFPKNISTNSIYFLSDVFFQKFKPYLADNFSCKNSHDMKNTVICSPKI